MKIILDENTERQLTAWWKLSGNLEFSGLADVDKVGSDFVISNPFLLDVGSPGYTRFEPDAIIALPRSEKRRCWFHRHPVGNGDPGPQNWSGTDHNTATKEPCGTAPQLIQWSISIVRTPRGWTGRLDIYVPKLRTFYLAVEPAMPSEEMLKEADILVPIYSKTVEAFKARNRAHEVDMEDWGWDDDIDYCDGCDENCGECVIAQMYSDIEDENEEAFLNEYEIYRRLPKSEQEMYDEELSLQSRKNAKKKSLEDAKTGKNSFSWLRD